MPSINWAEVFAHPLVSLKVFSHTFVRAVQALVARAFLPFRPRVLSLRTALARSWLASVFQHNALIYYSEPKGHGLSLLPSDAFKAYGVPSGDAKELQAADVVVLHCHGGGYVQGHALEHLSVYERWIAKAQEKGIRLVVLALDYPLGGDAKHPAQRDSMLALYQWTLDQRVPARKVVFSGDSAGGNLAAITAVYVRDHTSLPQPGTVVLHSAWLDLTCRHSIHKPVELDLMVNLPNGVQDIVDILRPAHLPRDTAELTPAFGKRFDGLAPQLVFWSTTEMLGDDSKEWVEKVQAAGGPLVSFSRSGRLHCFSLGWPTCSKKEEAEIDELLLEFLRKHCME